MTANNDTTEEGNPIDKSPAPLPPINNDNNDTNDSDQGAGRPKTSNPGFREPNKLPRLISAGTAAKVGANKEENNSKKKKQKKKRMAMTMLKNNGFAELPPTFSFKRFFQRSCSHLL